MMRNRAVRAAALAAALFTQTRCGDGDDPTSADAAGAAADAGTIDAGAIDAGADAVLLPGDDVYPEGVTALPDGTLFVGSLNRGTIFRVPPGGQPEPFAGPDEQSGLVNTVGVLASPSRGALLACSADLTGAAPSGIRTFDLSTGAPTASLDFPTGGFCNDLAVDAAGRVYATDSFGPHIYVDRGAGLELLLEDERFAGEGFNLNGIEVDGDVLYAVKYNTGELFRIPLDRDGRAGEATQVDLGRPLESPDGLRREASGRLLVVEGVGRLTRIDLRNGEPTLSIIVDGLNGPTTVAVVGNDAWVVEGQLAHLTDPTSGPPVLPFRVVRVPLD